MRFSTTACRGVVAGFTLGIVAAFSAPAGAADQTGHPNILFLIADEFCADCLGIAGHPIVKTPSLDALARSGARFSNAYSASPVCSPDRRDRSCDRCSCCRRSR